MHPYRSVVQAMLIGASFVGCSGRGEEDLAEDSGTTPEHDQGASAHVDDVNEVRADAGEGAATASVRASKAALSPDLDLGLDCTTDAGHETLLGCTGLYVRWDTKTLSPDVKEYDPALHLWSDGATKTRYVLLPPGHAIDTHEMDEWVFPVGTKLWKEFRIDGKRVETRYEEKLADGTWFRTTYAWSADQTTAEEVTLGVRDVWGTGYDIPAQSDCAKCHNGRIDGVLGFEAVGLSHPQATGMTMGQLVSAGLITNPPPAPIRIPGNAVESAALGWLHANCGTSCHSKSPSSTAGWTKLHMRLDVASMATVQETETWKTTVNLESHFQPTPGQTFFKIKPRDVEHSAIPYRDGRRDDDVVKNVQMPPLATKLVDTSGVQLIKDWINAM